MEGRKILFGIFSKITWNVLYKSPISKKTFNNTPKKSLYLQETCNLMLSRRATIIKRLVFICPLFSREIEMCFLDKMIIFLGDTDVPLPLVPPDLSKDLNYCLKDNYNKVNTR